MARNKYGDQCQILFAPVIFSKSLQISEYFIFTYSYDKIYKAILEMILLYSLLIMNIRAYSLCSVDLLHFIIPKWWTEMEGKKAFLLKLSLLSGSLS